MAWRVFRKAQLVWEGADDDNRRAAIRKDRFMELRVLRRERACFLLGDGVDGIASNALPRKGEAVLPAQSLLAAGNASAD